MLHPYAVVFCLKKKIKKKIMQLSLAITKDWLSYLSESARLNSYKQLYWLKSGVFHFSLTPLFDFKVN